MIWSLYRSTVAETATASDFVLRLNATCILRMHVAQTVTSFVNHPLGSLVRNVSDPAIQILHQC
jgi:hypothetical protein